MKILIVKTSAIGDVTHTLPVLHALRSSFPDAHITWLVEKASAGIISGHAGLDKILVCGRKSWLRDLRGNSPLRALKQIYRFIQALRADQYDLIIDFQGLLKSGIWVFLARGKRKIGFGRGMDHAEHSFLFYNEKVPAVSMEHHAVDRYLMLLSAIGASGEKVEFNFPVDRSDRAKIDQLLRMNEIVKSDKIAAINPMARWDTKLWEDEKFADVADRIARMGFKVCFTGAFEDSARIGQILSRMKEPGVSFAGATSLKSLAALYERSCFLITTDTGPMHIAAAVKTPVLALFGPTAPWRTGPYGDNHEVVQVTLDCSPCFKRECPTRDCMKKITPEMIMEKIDRISSRCL